MSRAGVARADDSLVVDTTKVCIEQLKELSLKLQQNKEGLSKEDLEGYRLEIAKLLKEVIDTQFADVKTVEAIDSVLGQRQNGRDPEETKAVIKQKINEATAAYDATKDVDFVQITSILKGLSDELDEDFVMIDRGLTDADIKCPFTAQQFQEPMKNPGGPQMPKCIHHVSRVALDTMCKKANWAKCPIGGCMGRWSKATAVLDEEFDRKIQKYLQNKSVEQMAASGGEKSSSSQDGYTQL